MGVPANTGPVLNVGPAAAAAEQQLNPPRSFDVVWSLNHADDVGECTCPDAHWSQRERPGGLSPRDTPTEIHRPCSLEPTAYL